jgi:AAA+ ATPase superfamily predicted ATPase
MADKNRPLKVFLSYSHADSVAVRSLYQRLVRDGVDAWIDKEKLLPGQDWEYEIRRAVESADVVLVCLSKDFNQRGFRQREIRIVLDAAQEKPEGEIFIIPVRLEESIPPDFLDRYHWVDIYKNDGYESLLHALRQRAEKSGIAPETIRREKSSWLSILNRINRSRHLDEISVVSRAFPRLPSDLDDFQRNFIIEIETITHYARAAVGSETNFNRRQQLQNALQSTQELIQYVAAAPTWQFPSNVKTTLERWEGVFENEISRTQKWEPIPNVYVAGMPLNENSAVFKGRKDIIRILERELATEAKQRPALLLYGARRTGKTSVLRQFPDALGPKVVPVMVDLQSLALTNNIVTFFEKLSDEIRKSMLTSRRIKVAEISRENLENDPYMFFAEWMKQVEDDIKNMWLLLSLDEYEYIEKLISSGRADERIFQLLRSLLQNYPRITLLFSGAHTFNELDPVWSHHLINVHTIKIGDLDIQDARELIEKPVKSFPLKYEKDAVNQILSVVGGQPYLLQVTCRDLVNLMNDNNQLNATLPDANRALDSALISGDAYFKEVWMGPDSSNSRRKIMAAIAKKKGTTIQEKKLLNLGTSQDIRLLVDHDVIEKIEDGYRFKVELVRRWIEKRA